MFNQELVKPKEVIAKMDELELNVYFMKTHVEDLKETVKYYQGEVNDLTNVLLKDIDDVYEYDDETGEPYFTRDILEDFTGELNRGIELLKKAQRDLETCKKEYVEYMNELEDWLKERVGMEDE